MADSPEIASPCVQVCRMHAPSGLCEGCARTLEEIAAWGRADAATRIQVLAQLPARRTHLREQGVFIPDDSARKTA